MLLKKLLTMLSLIAFIAIIVACSEDSNDPSDNDYTLTQEDLDNADNVLIASITGDEYGDAAIPHGGQDLTPDETIREVLGNMNSLNDDIDVGTIITKKTYMKDDMGDKGDLLVTFAMVKRKDGYYPEGGDWEYYQMPNDGTVDYNQNPNGEIAKAAASGQMEMCAGCHASASGSNWLFVK